MPYGDILLALCQKRIFELRELPVLPDHPAWLAHERCGSGPPLVLIHGLGSRWQVWDPVLPAVSRHHDVIALDLPGFGASPAEVGPAGGRGPVTVGSLADRVALFLAALGLRGADRPHIAGSSLGGGIALELGRRGLASRVTAFSPVGFWGPAGRRWCQLVIRGTRGVSIALAPALPALLANRAGRVTLCGMFYARPGRLDPAGCLADARALAGAEGMAAACAGLAHWRPADVAALAAGTRLGRLADLAAPAVSTGPGHLTGVPVTIAWGTRDLVLPYRTQARRARAVLPHAAHIALPGCGHLPFADDPRACARILCRDTSAVP